ncbi:DNA cytosine methyltransferase [Streptomyces sp. NPDC090085]|uniref:DNA cytosine methyltransferase n=1 Tax=Streptomyces sp. NPDC090085 TaxID=3365943 RepID=UPI00381150EC
MDPRDIPATFSRRHLTYDDLEGKRLDDFTTPADLADLDQLAGIYPVTWLFPAPAGKVRILHLFGGCGGWCVGVRLALGDAYDAVCIDINADATATARASGCYAVQADVTTLDPEHFCLRHVNILMASPPCTAWTRAGKQLGHVAANREILIDAIDRAAWAAGNYTVDGSDYCTHDDMADCEDLCFEHRGEPSGETWDEVRALTAGMTDPTAGLMLEPVIFFLALTKMDAPLTGFLMEQSHALPQDIREEIDIEIWAAEWMGVRWETIDAADYGSPSHRRRAILMATRYTNLSLTCLDPHEPLTTHAADALGMDPGAVVVTRANRKTKGGNHFSMDRVVPGITSKIRGWYLLDDETFRFTIPQAAALVTLPRDHPLTGSRTSMCQQLADVVAPVVALMAMAVLTQRGGAWRPTLKRYLADQYPNVHGPQAAAQPPCDGFGGALRCHGHHPAPAPAQPARAVPSPRPAPAGTAAPPRRQHAEQVALF